jgi:hypothetical protein
VLTNYFPQRHAVFLQQLRSAGLYPSLDAPVFSQHGGRVARGFALSMSGPGPIYYTTDGTDPRVYGTGAIAPTARLYTAGQPVILTGSTVVKARTLSGTNWSALTEASFVVESLVPQLRITEIMYNPIGGDSYEFIELQNLSDRALDVSQFSFSGITFVFPVMSILAPGQVIVLALGQYARELDRPLSGRGGVWLVFRQLGQWRRTACAQRRRRPSDLLGDLR